MTRAEIIAFNSGVDAVLAIAEKAASAITRTSTRHVHEDFAVAALSELAEAGRALLIPIDPPAAPASTAPVPGLYHQAQTMEVQ